MSTAKQAIEIIKNGGVAIFPTDTAFGIGCRIDDREAVDRLFQLRKRSRTQAVPVLVASIDMALLYFRSPHDIVRRYMEAYWPGGLTIIDFCKKDLVYSPVRGDGETIGLRMPDHPVTLEIIKGVGVPILGPSANFHGLPTPYAVEDLDPELIQLVDVVVEGAVKEKHQASTVVDCSVEPPKIVRQGAVILHE